MVDPPDMMQGPRAYTFVAAAALGLMVLVGRPLLKLHDEASRHGDFTPVFAIGLMQDTSHTPVPVVLVP